MEDVLCDSGSFEFNLSLVRIESIKKASHRFSSHFLVKLSKPSENVVVATLQSLARKPAYPLSAEQFPAEVMEQELRETIASETKSVRELLLAQAFSGLALITPEMESADFRDDPLGIASNDRNVRQGQVGPTRGGTDDD
jgi:His-Xaa-Ser system protein HxsD